MLDPPKMGGGKDPISNCFCAYISDCRVSRSFQFQSLLFSQPCLLVGWKGFAKVFIDNHTKSRSYFSDF